MLAEVLFVGMGSNGVKMESIADGVGAQSGGGIAPDSKGFEVEQYNKVRIHYC